MSVIEYNIKSANKYGWSTSWFGATDFNETLIENIKQFQKDHGLTVDGMCGPATYRRKFNDSIANDEEQSIVCNGENVIIDWPKVITWFEPNGLKAPSGSYTKKKTKRDVRMFVNHWDVCVSSQT